MKIEFTLNGGEITPTKSEPLFRVERTYSADAEAIRNELRDAVTCLQKAKDEPEIMPARWHIDDALKHINGILEQLGSKEEA